MDAGSCVKALEDALARFGKPEIFNTDQGSQFTSNAFTGVLRAAEIKISMDRSEEHTSELQSLMRISYAVFCLKKKQIIQTKSYMIQDTNLKYNLLMLSSQYYQLTNTN